ncbi:hypothetical protein CT138_01995 [Mannheimia varigena]|uniref:retron Eco8 family effector endonuclease n=1 Tax=Mannheimia varigena TaxID=85404 RepID=UPI000DBF390A|nr:retron Eco8 family effector endonuclease [Mannheimia varigena]AWW33695.1 hypothetical protein CT138_01995 [Mannheimia varigena]
MSIKSIRIQNILSFQDETISEFKFMNCIIGVNNAGKSNLLRIMQFFFEEIKFSKTDIELELYSNYSSVGKVSIIYDLCEIYKKTPLKDRYKELFEHANSDKSIEIIMEITSKGDVKFNKDRQILNCISFLFPMFFIKSRDIDLHNWNVLWGVISSIKMFKFSNIEQKDMVSFIDNKINSDRRFEKFICELNDILKTKKANIEQKKLHYIMSCLNGYEFTINDKSLIKNSDGTNSFYFLNKFIDLIIYLSDREYVTPFLFVDEPEIGLHPQLNEELVYKIQNSFNKIYKKRIASIQPRLILVTHSPNVLKEIIKNFIGNNKIFLFTHRKGTKVQELNSSYKSRFLNIFGDNESRLFFSKCILFIEGQSELELFSNKKLKEQFHFLKNIDFYICNNVTGESINPSQSKSGIPYLFLFDLDKILDIKINGDIDAFTVDFKKNGEIFKFDKGYFINRKEYYKKGYNEKYAKIKKNLDELILLSEKTYRIDKAIPSINKDEKKLFNEFFEKINQYTKMHNIKFISTTFEGLIITSTSYRLFFQWINHKYDICKKNKCLYEWIEGLDKNYDEETISLSLRVYMEGGKTDFLTTRKSIEKNFKDSKVSKILEDMSRMKFISSNDFKKASGWVTEFIDFSVDEINKKIDGKGNFSHYFSRYFPELYAIITGLQFDSFESS